MANRELTAYDIAKFHQLKGHSNELFDFSVGGHARTLSEIKSYPRDAFLQKIHQAGVPVEVDAFGQRSRNQSNHNNRPYIQKLWLYIILKPKC